MSPSVMSSMSRPPPPPSVAVASGTILSSGTFLTTPFAVRVTIETPGGRPGPREVVGVAPDAAEEGEEVTFCGLVVTGTLPPPLPVAAEMAPAERGASDTALILTMPFPVDVILMPAGSFRFSF